VPQTVPQLPQFRALLWTFTQTLLQLVSPFWHTQTPLMQSIPAPHTLPQRPQFWASWVVSVQLLPQSVPT
jgi:hypothetical protein